MQNSMVVRVGTVVVLSASLISGGLAAGQDLVEFEKRVALSTTVSSGTPGYKYPGLYVFHAVPMKGHIDKESSEA